MSSNFFKIRQGLNFANLSSDPASGVAGDVYFSSTTNTLRVYNGTAWLAVGSGSGGVGQVTYVDTTSTTKPSSTPYSPDGTALIAGDIVLFTNLSSGNNQAFSAAIAGSAITWTSVNVGQSTNGTPTLGDLIFIDNGLIFALQLMNYNGAAWERFPQIAVLAEKNYFKSQGGNPKFANNSIAPWTGASTTISSNAPSTAPAGLVLGGTNINFTATSSNPLSALDSNYNGLLVTPAGSGVQGQMILSGKMTINRGDLAKVISGSLTYELTANAANFNASGVLGSQSLAVWIYNVNSGAWTQPAGFLGMNQTAGQGRINFTFQTDSTAANNVYQVALICMTTQTTSFSLAVNDFQLGSAPITQGAVVSDWTTYTPTGAWTSNASYTGKWRRVGDSMEVRAKISLTGAPNNVAPTVTMPSGYAIDTTKLLSTSTFNDTLGIAGGVAAGGSVDFWVKYFSSTAVTITYQNSLNGGNGSMGNVVPVTFANGDGITIEFSVPIVGWSSTVQMSSDTDTRVVAASFNTASTQALTAGTTNIIYGTQLFDTQGAMNASTGVYTVPISGIYEIIGSINAAATTNIDVYKNGSTSWRICYAGQSGQPTSGSVLISCNAGDTLSLRSSVTTSLNSQAVGNYVSINRLSGPSSIAATESVNMAYSDTSGGSVGTGVTKYTYGTKQYDSHNAYASGTYTAPVSGKYRVSATLLTASVSLSTAQGYNMYVFKNGTQYAGNSIRGTGVSASYSATISATVSCLAGDTLDIRVNADTATTGNTAAGWNVISIERVGN